MPERRHAFLWLLIVFSFFRFGHDVARFAIESPFIDVGHYVFYTSLVAAGGNPLDQSDVARFKQSVDYRFSTAPAHYPPFFYLYMRPITWIPFEAARLVWLGFMISLLLAAPVLLLGKGHFSWRRPESLLPYVLLLWAQPVYEDLAIGQSNILLFFVIVCACRFLKKGQPFWAGVCFAFAAMSKLHYGLFGLYYLWRRDWPVFRGIAAGGVVFGLAGLAATSVQQHVDLVAFALNPPPGFISLPTNISIAGAFARSADYTVFAGLTAAKLLTWTSIVAIVLPLFALGRWRGLSASFDVSMVVVLVPLLSPLVEEFHLIALFLTFCVLNEEGGIWQCRRRTALYLFAYLFIASRFSLVSFDQFHGGPQSVLLSAKIAGVLALYVLSLAAIRDKSRTVAGT